MTTGESTTGGSMLTPTAVATPQTVVYCTSDDVGRLLGFGTGYFTSSTTPSTTDVQYYIQQAQDVIDELTGHAWRLRTSKAEYHEMARLGRRVSWFLWLGYPIFLNHRMVQPLNSFTTTTTAQLTGGQSYTSVSVSALGHNVPNGTQVVINPYGAAPNVTVTTLTVAASSGDTTLTVASFKAPITYASSTVVMTFSQEIGDRFEVMTSFNTWEDWTNLINYSPGGGGQVWADWNNGIVYIYFAYLGMRQFSARFVYRYGDVDSSLAAVVPGDIKMAAQLYAARLLVLGSEKWNLLPQQANNIIDARSKVDQWLGQFDAIIQRHSEYGQVH